MTQATLDRGSIRNSQLRGAINFCLLPVSSLTLVAFTIAGSAIAQVPSMPQVDRNGDYFSNETPIKGTAPKPLMSGSLWQVMSSRLNCRSRAEIGSSVVRQFHKGALLQTDVGRGGSDEVLLNATDKSGKPWMRVRSSQGTNYNCYVRANKLYIQPYQRP